MVPDLGLGPDIWLLLTLLMGVSIFVSFRRPWSLRNLDLLLLFILAPGIVALVGRGDSRALVPFIWLFIGTGLWIVRCLVDLGLPRRPLLEPNLNAPGLICLTFGMLILLVAESINLPLRVGEARNPAASDDPELDQQGRVPAVSQIGDGDFVGPLPMPTRPGVVQWRSSQIILSRVLAGLSHVGVVVSLVLVGRRQFGRPLAGISAASCYAILPYTRIEVVDSGQIFPAALIVAALGWHRVPAVAGALIGLAAGWMPACVGLLPLWSGFYRGRHIAQFAGVGLAVLAACAIAGLQLPVLSRWAGAMGGPQPRRSGPPTGARAADLREPLGRGQPGLPAPGVDRVSGDGGDRLDLAVEEESRRPDRDVGRRAAGQPVLVHRAGRDDGPALPADAFAHDVPAKPGRQAGPPPSVPSRARVGSRDGPGH